MTRDEVIDEISSLPPSVVMNVAHITCESEVNAIRNFWIHNVMTIRETDIAVCEGWLAVLGRCAVMHGKRDMPYIKRSI